MKKIVNAFQYTVRLLIYIVTPGTWRAIFLGQVRVAFCLDNGRVIKLNVKNVKCSPGQSYSFDGAGLFMTIDPAKIVAMKEVYWF